MEYIKMAETEFCNAMFPLTSSEKLAFIYMCDNMNLKNICPGTYVEFKERLGVSNKTMIITMVNLQKHDLIRMVHPALWMINPKYALKCSKAGIPELFTTYANLKTFEERRRKKKQEEQKNESIGSKRLS